MTTHKTKSVQIPLHTTHHRNTKRNAAVVKALVRKILKLQRKALKEQRKLEASQREQTQE